LILTSSGGSRCNHPSRSSANAGQNVGNCGKLAAKLADMAKHGQAASTTLRKSSTVLVLHGPNLNLLGSREPGIYGSETLEQINQRLARLAKTRGATVEVFQSNHEGDLIEQVHSAKKRRVSWIIVNPGGLTHTSVALRDALAAVSIPFIEVHLSNIYSREPFRRSSYFADLAVGMVCGLGSRGYDFALEFVLQKI